MSSLFQRALGWYGLGFPGCCSRASFSCGENRNGLRLESLGETTLASRDALCNTPPFWRGFSLFGVDSGRVLGFRAQTRLGSDGVLTSRQERFAMQLRVHHLEPRSGLITGDFVNRKVSQNHFCVAGRNSQRGSFFRDPFPVRTRFAFVSLRQACYRLVQVFSIPVDSPWDQRGKSRS